MSIFKIIHDDHLRVPVAAKVRIEDRVVPLRDDAADAVYED